MVIEFREKIWLTWFVKYGIGNIFPIVGIPPSLFKSISLDGTILCPIRMKAVAKAFMIAGFFTLS